MRKYHAVQPSERRDATTCPVCHGFLSEEPQREGRRITITLFCIDESCGWREWTDAGAEIRSMSTNGASAHQIASELGVSTRTVWRERTVA